MMRVIINIILESLAIAVVLRFVTKKPLAMEDIVRVTLVVTALLVISRLLSPEIFPHEKSQNFVRPYQVDSSFMADTSFEGFDEDARFVRVNNVLYSGDLVNLQGADVGKTDNLYMQRNITSSEVLLNAPIDGIHTNLSKLRFELLDHDPQMTKPIKYGDTVYIKHNANINNLNSSRFIKISDTLLSHQEGPLFNQFQIFNVASPTDTGYVKPDTPVAIKSLKSGGIPEGYLVIGDDKKLKNTATSLTDANKFTIGLQRVVELNDQHLSVEVNSTLYP